MGETPVIFFCYKIYLMTPSNFLGILVSMSDYDLRWVHISPVNGHTTRLLVFITIQTLCIFRLPLVDLSSFHSHLFMYHFMLMAWNTSKKNYVHNNSHTISVCYSQIEVDLWLFSCIELRRNINSQFHSISWPQIQNF